MFRITLIYVNIDPRCNLNEKAGGWGVPSGENVIKDRFGVPKPHPAATILKGEVGNFTRLYKALALEAPNDPDSHAGRPDGWSPGD